MEYVKNAIEKGGEIMWRERGWRHWYRMTGLPGWVRASMGLPAWGCWWYPWAPYWNYPTPYPTPEEELEILKEKETYLKEELEAIQQRIKDLEKEIKK
jgi:hypothetical protein